MKRLLATIAFALSCALAGAQTVQPILQPHQTYSDGAGFPCTGCSLFSYTAGTTTPKATYSDSAGVTPNTNPVILDVAGGASVWLAAGAYKFVLKGVDGSTIWTVDNVNPVNSSTGTFMPTSGGTFTGAVSGTSMAAVSMSPATLTVGVGVGMTGNQGDGLKVQHSTGAPTANNCAKFDANGNTADAGAPCSSFPTSGTIPATCTTGQLWTNPSPATASGVIYECYATNSWFPLQPALVGTPTLVNDSGTAVLSLVSGSTDSSGVINANYSVAPTGGAGLITLVYSLTLPTIAKCSISPANAAAAALAAGTAPFVNQSDSSTAHFVIRSAATPIATATAYQWGYSCKL